MFSPPHRVFIIECKCRVQNMIRIIILSLWFWLESNFLFVYSKKDIINIINIVYLTIEMIKRSFKDLFLTVGETGAS